MEYLENDPLWFKNAVIYQLHIKAFCDSDADGIGDLAGLRQKLDYLESLGITAIWLLPFYPSPMRDDGYDIANYMDVNPAYGNLKDFKRFLQEAHRRGIRVITELVINHTSDQHPWFQRARQAKPGSSWRDFYVWSDSPTRYKDARIIFKDFEVSNWTWDPVANAYYWHRFYSHQPDLNFDNPLVQKEVFRALDYWFEMGVDGLRLDAIPYLFERDGTNCENLAETHEFLKKLRKHVDDKFKDKVFIAEANQWPEDAAAYFGEGDECHMAFHFPVMPRLFMAIHMEDRFPIIDILEQTPTPPDSCQWVMFLRNHDELTLEMVSDEERDYMYRIYAKDPKARINLGIRRRLAPLLDNDRARIELMYILLLSLPGTPVIYYGDEIGMGDNYYLGDRDGVRTPMQWSSDRNAGFSTANPQQLYLPMIIDPLYHYAVINVENQERNPSSLLWWIRRLLVVRKNYKAFGSGKVEYISSSNPKALAFIRSVDGENILIVVNLSRFPQATELELAKYSGYLPRELFHQNPFPLIGEGLYNITLGPYGYFWLSLKPSEKLVERRFEEAAPRYRVEKSWEQIFVSKSRQFLERRVFPRFLKESRWFERKTATINHTRLLSQIPVENAFLCMLEVTYLETEEIDNYLLAISYAEGKEAENLLENIPKSVLAHLSVGSEEGILYASTYDEGFRQALLEVIIHKRHIKTETEELVGIPGNLLKKGQLPYTPLPSQILWGEQSNSSLLFGQQYFLKFYRRLEEGIQPEIEMNRFLTETVGYKNTPQFAGLIEWRRPGMQPTAIVFLEEYVPNEGTGWSFALDTLTKFYEEVLVLKNLDDLTGKIKEGKTGREFAPLLDDLIGGRFLEAARLLGQRTAEMHIALASNTKDPAFRPEPFSLLYQRSVYQSTRSSLRTVFQALKKYAVDDSMKEMVSELLSKEQELLTYFRRFTEKVYDGMRTRIHGDFHLGQTLYTGKDFMIIDFEGEPLMSMSARRIKRSPLRDVAGMIRSLHYAAHRVLFHDSILIGEKEMRLRPWGDLWYERVSQLYLESYMKVIGQSPLHLVPENEADRRYFLQCAILNKCIYEVGYELNTRPDWVAIPCQGLLYNVKKLKG